MRDICLIDQQALVLQILVDLLVGVVNKHPCVGTGFIGKIPLTVNRREDRQIIIKAAHIIFPPMAGCGVYYAGTGLQCYIVRQDDK